MLLRSPLIGGKGFGRKRPAKSRARNFSLWRRFLAFDAVKGDCGAVQLQGRF
jgi:hypothetical protein